MTNCGYPGDKPLNTLWITGGEIERHSDLRLFYTNDTAGGQSGSPVYTWYGDYWTVIGVHCYGGCHNSADTMTQIISQFMRRMDVSKKLQSVEFPAIYVRCDVTNTVAATSTGSATVNCQHQPTREWEKFCIIAKTIAPSLAVQETHPRMAIESFFKENVYIRTNGRSMTGPSNSSGGVVNCQFSAFSLETYFIKEEDGDRVYSIVSAVKSQIRIRVDGNHIHEPTHGGAGEVNCQYYDDMDDPARSLERIRILDA